MIPNAYELNFDSIVGPTHNYSGLSKDNIASVANKETASNPKAAALQSLEKMKLLLDLGIRQAVLPPHERPHIPTLRALGFQGLDRSLPEKAYKEWPEILFFLSSASAMWTANIATITPSVDSSDHKVHITPANLAKTTHRSIESHFTGKLLKRIFSESPHFLHHSPLPLHTIYSDEGSANQLHFCRKFNHTGLNVFVYGDSIKEPELTDTPQHFRQSLEASQVIARSHCLFPNRTLFIRQSARCLEESVFHNDLVAVGCKTLLFLHEDAWDNQQIVLENLQSLAKEELDTTLSIIEVPREKIPLRTAIDTYVFNSQLIPLPDNTYTLIAPKESQKNSTVYQYLDQLTKDSENPLRDIHYIDLQESMKNGGGPACLRLRTLLTQDEINALHPSILFTERLFAKLVGWVERHYRDRLEPADLADPDLVDETEKALDELSHILNLGSLYSFQK